jgi:hypothetical protein
VPDVSQRQDAGKAAGLEREGSKIKMMSNEMLLTVLNSSVALVSAVVLWFIKQSGEAAAAGAKSAAEEGAKVAIKNINWSEELRQEIEKSRGVERQNLRFESYGELWKRMRPLAIYTDGSITSTTLSRLHEDLTDWYFSKSGGMFLLPHTREFYFSLQDFSRAVGDNKDWNCKRDGGQYDALFDKVMRKISPTLMTAVREAISNTKTR